MSGNVNVGFLDGRVSSRVLKPPGGGYSEIFFTQNDDEAVKKTPKSPPARVQTTIESILCTEFAATKIVNNETVSKTSTKSESQTVEKVDKEETCTNSPVETQVQQLSIAEEAAQEAAPEPKQEAIEVEAKQEDKTGSKQLEEKPKRTRVPPGGYSSGLW